MSDAEDLAAMLLVRSKPDADRAAIDGLIYQPREMRLGFVDVDGDHDDLYGVS